MDRQLSNGLQCMVPRCRLLQARTHMQLSKGAALHSVKGESTQLAKTAGLYRQLSKQVVLCLLLAVQCSLIVVGGTLSALCEAPTPGKPGKRGPLHHALPSLLQTQVGPLQTRQGPAI